VIGALLSGLLLGPSVLGQIAPEWFHIVFPAGPGEAPINAIANIGVMLLLLLTGMEVDLNLVRNVGRPAIAVATMGVFIPFICGLALGETMPEALLPNPARRTVAALFLGIALAISSIKIVAAVVTEMNLLRRDLGQIIVASAILEDTAGWIILSLVLGFAGTGGTNFGQLGWTFAGTIAFLALSHSLGRPLVFRLIRLANDHAEGDFMVITVVLLAMLAMALITQAIGVGTALGAFTAGVLVGESPILTGQIKDQLQGFITAFLMPIFFGLSGLGTDLTILRDPTLLLLTCLLVLMASLGKFAGAAVGAVLSRLRWREAIALGCAMNARGSTEIIVASIGLSAGVLSREVYTMILAMAVLTTMAMPPTLRRSLSRLPLSEAEAARLRKEAIDAGGFVSRFERVLVAVDDSANGAFATRLAGFLAGQRELPITVLTLTGRDEESVARLVDAAKQTARLAAHVTEAGKERRAKGDVDVIARGEAENGAEIVAAEAKKGFDLLMVGLAEMRDADGGFTDRVHRLAYGFDGPIALVMAGSDRHFDQSRRGTILIPVNDTESSRRGAELAFGISPPTSTRCVVVQVIEHEAPRRWGLATTAEAVRDTIAALAARHGFHVTILQRRDADPAPTILRTAAATRADLLVIGADRRVGEALALGKTVAAVTRGWRGDLVILANQARER
jgi:Kef-type K+ transport system membrane component KefB/nucleotide-binding universal stress UspA family protein